ncbi:MAG: cysteine desulfurase NifS [Candidatus Goldbacteria bacterium]|nr:cysteine desulfurase NifS [Candidatus Goldiibacteriota bacterium]
MKKIIYLDNNATTRIDKRVLQSMLPYLEEYYANPSGIYYFAQEVKKEIEKAREKVAKFLNATPFEIIFTSGGTESDNFAIKGIAFANREKGKHIITSSIEHHAVLNTLKYLEKQGFEITFLPVDKYGIVDIDALKESIRKDTILISIMYANNEIGTIEPIKEIGEIARNNNVYFHTDAVQAAGKIKIDVKELNVDLLSISGHKFYGPKGIGALFIRKGVKIEPVLHGGHHERNQRAGTENVAGIIGLGRACEIAEEDLKNTEIKNKKKKLKDKLEKGILEKIPEVIVNGHPEKRIDNTLNICIKYIEGESILIQLDFEGICASSGSACTSGSLEPSHVLLALGLPHEIAHGSLRFSLSKYTEEEEIDKVLEVLPGAVQKLRNLSPFWKEKKI